MTILSDEMRRTLLIALSLAALAVPAAALAMRQAPGDGTLVVKGGSAPDGVPVVRLVIDGTVLGHVVSSSPDVDDRVVITDNNVAGGIQANAAASTLLTRKSLSDTKTLYSGSDFRFRASAPGGVYTVAIYGSGVDLFAIGHGKVILQGQPDPTVGDGRFSLNGQDFHSLPAAPTAWLQISVSSTG